jgi:hypothetical protein
MKQVAVLFDALRNEQFAVAVRDNSGTIYYGAEGQGREWAQWVNSNNTKSLNTSELPSGIVLGTYKPLNDVAIKSLINELGYNENPISNAFTNSQAYISCKSVKMANTSIVPAVMDTPISHFTKEQYLSVIGYKGLTFRTQVKEGSFLFEARVNQYSYDFEREMFNALPSKANIKSLRQRLDSNLSRSTERRIGAKMKSAILDEGGRTHVGASFSLETKSLDFETKGIGERIGGSAGSGSRGARRIARMASEPFDPKAVDGDNDGLVQEGSAFERPATPKVPGAITRMGASVGDGFDPKSSRNGTGTRKAKPGERIKLKPASALGAEFDPEKASRLEGRRTAKPAGRLSNTGQRSRVSTARTDITTSGLSSRSERAKKKALKKAIPGINKVDDNDGSTWDSLTSDQKIQVAENLRQRRKDVESRIKKTFPGWFEGFTEANKDKKDPDGVNWNKDSRIVGAVLADLDVEVADAIEAIDADTEMDDATKAKKKNDIQKMLDDLKTLTNMEERDDYSLLEHLHPASRKAAAGKVRAAGKKDSYKDVFSGGKTPSLFTSTVKSSIFGEPGGVTNEKPLVGKKGDAKLKNLVRRLAEPNPERVRRRELRKLKKKKGNVGAFEVGEDAGRDPIGDTKRRIRKAKRALAAKLRGTRSDTSIEKAIKKGQIGTMLKNDEGKITLTPESIKAMGDILGGVRKASKGDRADTLLGGLWDANNFNGLATPVTEEEAHMLIEAGWMPIQRGHKVEKYADDYISDPVRFITGEGGEAVGPGEYWAHPESSGWDSWIKGQSGTIAFLPPASKITTREEMAKHASDNRKITEAVDAFVSGFPKGEAEKMEPADFIRELKSYLAKGAISDSDSVWGREMGQMWSQIYSLYGSAEGGEKAQLWTAIKFMRDMARADKNQYATLLGYDAINLGKGDGRVLLMNRPGIAILDRTLTLPEIKQVAKKITLGA